jgi:cell division transport system ATP-binding protein
MQPIIETRDLTRIYRRGSTEVRAVDGISLSIMPGEFMAIMGRSGSGKTTLLDLLGCLLRPSGGELCIQGRSVVGASDNELAMIRRTRIGFVFQEFNLLPTLSAIENVMLPLRYGPRRRDARETAARLLRVVGLEHRERHRPSELSGGEQQRVAVARAFVNRPMILIADEPTGNLDPQTSVGIMRLLDRINRTGTTVVMATHDENIVDQMRKRVIELDKGRLVRDQSRGVYGYQH